MISANTEVRIIEREREQLTLPQSLWTTVSEAKLMSGKVIVNSKEQFTVTLRAAFSGQAKWVKTD